MPTNSQIRFAIWTGEIKYLGMCFIVCSISLSLYSFQTMWIYTGNIAGDKKQTNGTVVKHIMDYSLFETSEISNLTTSSVPADNVLSHLRALEYYSTGNKTFMNNATVAERILTPNATTYVHQQFYQLQHPLHAQNFTQYFNDSYYQCPSMQNPVGNLISMIMYTVVCVIGLFGNTLVIYVVLRFSKMKTVTNLYILNLAIADQSFLIGIPFLLITMYLNEWIFGSFLCKVYMVSTSITQFTSSIFLLIMAADRFIGRLYSICAFHLQFYLFFFMFC